MYTRIAAYQVQYVMVQLHLCTGIINRHLNTFSYKSQLKSLSLPVIPAFPIRMRNFGHASSFWIHITVQSKALTSMNLRSDISDIRWSPHISPFSFFKKGAIYPPHLIYEYGNIPCHVLCYLKYIHIFYFFP